MIRDVMNRSLSLAVALSIATAGCGGGMASGRKAAPPATTSAVAAPPSAGTAEYKGKTIVWDERVDPPRLVIDGRTIVPVRRVGGDSERRYHASTAMPYADTASLLELAHLLIDTGVLH
jgi:hypothetical protein